MITALQVAEFLNDATSDEITEVRRNLSPYSTVVVMTVSPPSVREAEYVPDYQI